jgi:hypothetical protein
MVASKSNNEQIDGDILQSKKDILRAHDVMPPYKKIDAEDKSHKQSEGRVAEVVKAQEDKGEIPRFDLAEEIMAEQRKISAIRRKAPGRRIETQKTEKEFGPVGYTIERPIPVQPYEEQIIAEIVARDIKRMCGGGYLPDSE